MLFWQPPLVWILLRQKLRQRLMLKITILSTSRPSILGFNSTNGGGFMPSLFSSSVPRETIGKKKSLFINLGWKKNENVWKSRVPVSQCPSVWSNLQQSRKGAGLFFYSQTFFVFDFIEDCETFIDTLYQIIISKVFIKSIRWDIQWFGKLSIVLLKVLSRDFFLLSQ